jgi:hypothetical protein
MSVNKVGVQFKVFKIFGFINIKAPPSARGEQRMCWHADHLVPLLG